MEEHMSTAEDRVLKMDEEIAAMEAATNGTPPDENQEDTTDEQTQDVEATETQNTEDQTQDTDEESFTEAEASDTEDQDEEEQQTTTKRRSWKQDFLQLEKRFNNYKGSTDATIHSLRVENTQLLDAYQKTSAELAKLQQKVAEKPLEAELDYNELLDEEQRNYLGQDGIEAVSKIAKALLDTKDKEQKSRLEQIEEQRRIDNENALRAQQQSNHQNFLNQVAKYVPNYLELAKNPEFSKFGDQTDPMNGRTVRELFQAAEQRHDIRTVVNYFRDFARLVQPSKELDENLSTSGQTGGTQHTTQTKPKGPVMLSMSKIMEFYDDLHKGRYEGRGDEVTELEAQIAEAEAKGNIIEDRPPHLRS